MNGDDVLDSLAKPGPFYLADDRDEVLGLSTAAKQGVRVVVGRSERDTSARASRTRADDMGEAYWQVLAVAVEGRGCIW